MKITIVISTNDPEATWNAFRFANTALANDDMVSVFLLGRGVEAPMVDTLQYDITMQIDTFRESGGRLVGCGVCRESRKEEMPRLEELLSCETGSMQLLYQMTAEADRVLTF